MRGVEPLSADAQYPPPQPDKIGGPSTTALADTVLEYRYSTGNRYVMRFAEETLSFDHIVPEGPTIEPLPYRARELRDELYLVTWIIKRGVVVTLAIDFTARLIHVSAMMPTNQWEFFDLAELLSVHRPEHASG